MALTKSLSFSLRRKRILISNNSCNLAEFTAEFDSPPPMKRRCGDDSEEQDEHVSEDSSSRNLSLLEALPHDILIKVVCGVNHDDLKQLIHVSKAVCDATLTAKSFHFAYRTPMKTKVVFSLKEDEELEAPNAPIQLRRLNRLRISERELKDISVVLFSDDEEEQQRWPRRNLFF